jgi:DNA-binding transcriptional MerR regulator
MNIGEVLARLRPDFPDVTISKIRFLESEGLVEPQRTPSGYRKFDHDDVQRLRYVLAAQRDHYLPLKVIKDHLEALDRGLEPPAQAGAPPRVPVAVVSPDGMPGPEAFSRDASELRLSRAELLDAAELTEEQLAEIEG